MKCGCEDAIGMVRRHGGCLTNLVGEVGDDFFRTYTIVTRTEVAWIREE
jgi:hypothetical protein